ncbi:hypothetical protein A1O1_02432 [Capronia coronata CBS 617.96]|uniref:Box C/D snoRNA protein 1 n=1 Tax=Capronia coronata CBS 617.96 TaxID=1182541 RepID=W9ZHS8_9EURO|nr:uncharacterized protein A1O1_02432 [Capronia coronata CBS 617.96]EXJ94039.1 hypothetical protein A1O1_02432 [Capronia coronata CBS 617.96]
MQKKEGDILLTDLCAICHTNPIKYTCPRCGIHTCSLPCVKRHKTWAQCSGVRNPAAYRKRADLATPASIDQDFNFITSVERSLQHADDIAQDKGIDLTPSGVARGGHESKRKFETEIEERGIHLVRAPKGLYRNKQNKSHWAGQYKCIMWTTEWLYFDGRRRVQNVTESRTVGEAFVNIFGKNSIRKKRRRSDDQSATAPATKPDIQPSSDRAEALESLSGPEKRAKTAEADHKEETESQQQPGLDDPSITSEPVPQGSEASQLLQNLHFYLLKSNTISKHKCLIPISPSSTIKEVLRGKPLLEFPTFYVREEAPEDLPEPYITDQKYEQLYGSEVGLDLPTYASDSKGETGEQTSLADIDEKRVLEVLQKDLAG